MLLMRRPILAAIPVKVFARSASNSALEGPAFQAIKVKCGGAGDTVIHVHNPPKTSPLPLLLHIAPTLEKSPLTAPPIHPSFLSNVHTTVLISPTFSSGTPFPQPLHVLSFAYDAILEHHAKSRDLLADKKAELPPLSVYGKGLGGTLATALALTDCRPLKETGTYVDAVMTRDSIYDYSPLANEYLRKYAKTKAHELETFAMHDYLSPDSDMAYASPPSDAYISGPAISTTPFFLSSTIKTRSELVKSLPHIFARPEIAFDPFISPVLFFRGRSHEIPTSWTWNGAPGKAVWQNPSLEEQERSRSYVTFPPKESGLAIPWTRFVVGGDEQTPQKRRRSKRGLKEEEEALEIDGTAGLQELYLRQADLMAKGMRRAIGKNHEDPRVLTAMGAGDVDAEERVQVVKDGNVGMNVEQDEIDGVAMNEWLKDIRG